MAIALFVPIGMARFVVFAAINVVLGAWLRHPLAAFTTAVIAWSLTTGFLLNNLGELTFSAADLERLVTLLVAALLGSVCGMLFWQRRAAPELAPVVVSRQNRPVDPMLTSAE
ncbi:hypothetical protein [Acrocarpospora catenulata]|uniref:hypothetical protein n=1 Tax=Acrocarpospora catenulata TaxID=2836182 RepID=UPI001BDB316B|nr:hypothetical protein [Acrocarpospora catenulata]